MKTKKRVALTAKDNPYSTNTNTTSKSSGRLNAHTLRESMRGSWRAYFESLGVNLPPSPSRHGPCPNCGGKDRFRFDDKAGKGTYICSQCGPGDGFSLARKILSCTFPEVLTSLAKHLSIPTYQSRRAPPPQRQDILDTSCDHKKRQKIKAVMDQSERIGTPMLRYLQNRGLSDITNRIPAALRFHRGLPYWNETRTGEYEHLGIHPVMLGVVTNPNGQLITLHRTYITTEGLKAQLPSVKKIMSPAVNGSLSGSSIKLGIPTNTLYLTEGIETALAVMQSTGESVWACISAKLMEQIVIPKNVNKVFIMADKDRSGTGEQSADYLALRLNRERVDLEVFICVPPSPIPTNSKSIDWLNIYTNTEIRGDA